MQFKKNKFYKAFSVYRILLCIGFFFIFVTLMTLVTLNNIKNSRYLLGLKQSINVLSEATVFVNFMLSVEEVAQDAYYLYLVDTLNTKFESTNCKNSKSLLCTTNNYKTLNGKSIISDEIFKDGERIIVANMLFMINKPKTANDSLIITVDTNGGNQKPNKLGHDVFIFQIVNTKLKAMGNKGTLYPLDKFTSFCNFTNKSKNELLGINCTYKALTDPNYFKDLQ